GVRPGDDGDCVRHACAAQAGLAVDVEAAGSRAVAHRRRALTGRAARGAYLAGRAGAVAGGRAAALARGLTDAAGGGRRAGLPRGAGAVTGGRAVRARGLAGAAGGGRRADLARGAGGGAGRGGPGRGRGGAGGGGGVRGRGAGGARRGGGGGGRGWRRRRRRGRGGGGGGRRRGRRRGGRSRRGGGRSRRRRGDDRQPVADLEPEAGRCGLRVLAKDGRVPETQVRAVGDDVIGEGAHDAGIGDVCIGDDDLLTPPGENRRAGAAGAIALQAGTTATGAERWRPAPTCAARAATVEPGARATHARSAEIGWQID